MPVEVIDVLGQHLLQMTPVDDWHPIQTLATHTAHPALSDRIRARCSNRAAQNVDANRLERSSELHVTITDQKPQAIHPTTKLHQLVPNLDIFPVSGAERSM